ncbi:MAG: HAD-IIB family hydrolase, partial [Gammaproteobacteria bacterium]|nr:HAD-IIB family hydrolase [Gammaproteobacteria bacterium]
AGYVGAGISSLLETPLVFTGHSLGRIKQQRLQEKGVKTETIESRYNIGRRIEAEEVALDNASFIIASTIQEIEEQYSIYERYQPKRMTVIPPGVNLSQFRPLRHREPPPPITESLNRFLTHPVKPMILALSRPDERKNIPTLVKAYGENPELRQLANLVIIAGNRDDIEALDRGASKVLKTLLLLIDKYDLYGSVALPKHHEPNDVPGIYRLAARTGGIFINPALTEPFGLTLIEAAASGLPIVATEDGGPQDIIGYCKNGLLINPLDSVRIGEALLEALSDHTRWKHWSRRGIRGAHRHFSWDGHVDTYLKTASRVTTARKRRQTVTHSHSRLPTADRLIICDVDDTLLGNDDALAELTRMLKDAGEPVGVGIATGRSVKSAVRVLRKAKVPTPDVLITSVGSEVYYGKRLIPDAGWRKHISYHWKPKALREAMSDIRGIRLQPKENQQEYKISYFIDPDRAPCMLDINRHLRLLNLQAKMVFSHNYYLDLLPIRASKGLALRHLSSKWGLPLERFLVAGDSGNDEEMLCGNTLAVVVGNYSQEIEQLRNMPRIYFAQRTHAGGIIEGIQHYNFLGEPRIDYE